MVIGKYCSNYITELQTNFSMVGGNGGDLLIHV